MSKRARNLRRNSTDAEQILWRYLCNRGLAGFKFRRQAPVGQYVVDFICESARVVIELDGGQHAVETGHDERREVELKARGYIVLRFWNNDVLKNMDGVISEIIAVVQPEDINAAS